MLPQIRVAKLDSRAIIPTRKHPSDAGMDFYALREETIFPHHEQVVGTGIAVDIPEGYVGICTPKGRNEHMLNAGVIDAGYQGEILFRVVNPFDYNIYLHPGDAVGQLLILPVETPLIVEEEKGELFASKTDRGATGGIWESYQAQS